MKIGIVTIIDYYNYGNRLQNYAVSYILRNRFRCEAITLEGYRNKNPYKDRPSYWIKEELGRYLCFFPSLATNILSDDMIRWSNFQNWSLRNIPIKRYYNCEQLPSQLNKKYDYFFAGSDQIWNYKFKDIRLNDFFLMFAEKKKRVSVSSSFGIDDIPDEIREFYSKALSEFSRISVREDVGAKIVKELINKNVPVLIDPVMMLDPEEWIHVEKTPQVDISKPYILKYYLGENTIEIDRWANNNNLRIHTLLSKEDKKTYVSGPGEFISLVRNATMVCSDSFHCIVLSILFARPFIVYKRQGKENYMSSRLETLLRKFHFENRWNDLLTPDEYLNCDFSQVNGILESERKAFIEYIAESINQSRKPQSNN